MKTFLKVLAVIFGLGFVGQLVAGKVFFAGLIIAIVCAYFGWKEKAQENKGNQ